LCNIPNDFRVLDPGRNGDGFAEANIDVDSGQKHGPFGHQLFPHPFRQIVHQLGRQVAEGVFLGRIG
jgi:hypothetical protein